MEQIKEEFKLELFPEEVTTFDASYGPKTEEIDTAGNDNITLKYQLNEVVNDKNQDDTKIMDLLPIVMKNDPLSPTVACSTFELPNLTAKSIVTSNNVIHFENDFNINCNISKVDPILNLVEERKLKTDQKVCFTDDMNIKKVDVDSKDFFKGEFCENEAVDDEMVDTEDFQDQYSLTSLNENELCGNDTIFDGAATLHQIQNSNNIENCINVIKTSSNRKKYIKPLKFICNYCDKKFPQSDILRRHIRIHTGEKPYECNFCVKRFRTRCLLQLHTTIHTGKRNVCTLCNKRFAQVGSLKSHMLTHEGKRPFKCADCPSAFYTKTCVLKHINRRHMKLEKIQAKETQNNKIVKISLKEDYICSDCGKTLNSKEGLREHVKRHTKQKLYSCNICGLKGIKKYILGNHKKIHVDVYSFTCSECNKSFKQKSGLVIHMKNTHSNDKPYKCTFCKSSFKASGNLKIHIEIHHNNNKTKKFICDICNMSFYRCTYLKRHLKIHTNSDRKFICDICGLQCRSKCDMERHIITHIGGGDKPFQCKICKMAFSKHSHYVRHQLVHSDERPYKCDLCNKAYKDPCSLKIHQNVHLNKTFICPKCRFRSINEHSFKRHVRLKLCKK